MSLKSCFYSTLVISHILLTPSSFAGKVQESKAILKIARELPSMLVAYNNAWQKQNQERVADLKEIDQMLDNCQKDNLQAPGCKSYQAAHRIAQNLETNRNFLVRREGDPEPIFYFTIEWDYEAVTEGMLDLNCNYDPTKASANKCNGKCQCQKNKDQVAGLLPEIEELYTKYRSINDERFRLVVAGPAVIEPSKTGEVLEVKSVTYIDVLNKYEALETGLEIHQLVDIYRPSVEMRTFSKSMNEK